MRGGKFEFEFPGDIYYHDPVRTVTPRAKENSEVELNL